MSSPCVLVVGDAAERAAAEDALRTGLGDAAAVVGTDTPDTAAGAVPAGHGVAVTVLLAGEHHVDDLIDRLTHVGEELTASLVLLTTRHMHDDLHRALDADLIQGIVRIPWAPASLTEEVAAQLVRWLRAQDPNDARIAELKVDRRPFRLPRSELLRDLELGEHDVSQRLVAALDRALGPRPRLRLPAGTRLSHQDVSIDGVVVVLSGTVALDRETEVGELRLHHATTGPMVGLLALAQQSHAFFTARSTTDVEVLHVSLGQLDLALRTEPEVGAALAAVALRVLAQRLKRSEDLQVEKVRLNQELEAEQDSLQAALTQLEAARLELVESARFATLGELAAGIAHELNNPVASLGRAADYLVTDLAALLADHPSADVVLPALEASRSRTPRSTADERAARRELTRALGDDDLARRLVAAGITDVDEARRLTAGSGPQDLELIEMAAGLGSAARNLEVASTRIAELVASLRSYARPSTEPLGGVDVHTTLEDTLRLVAHRLPDTAHIERVYGELPSIRANPGELGQVWTNLIVNAAESLDQAGQLRLVTAAAADHIEVRIEDDGPGLAPEALERAFEPRFTTKQGTIRYGLGLGLAIAKRIVDAHGGSITLRSEPGRTVATVRLPITGPTDQPSQEMPG